MAAKVNYNAMDVAKFLSAILLVCAHTASERVSLPEVLDLCCSLYIITVPFFFIATSFLFFTKFDSQSKTAQSMSYKKYTKRIWTMYLAWSLVYVCFILIKWMREGVVMQDVLRYVHHAIVFTTYPTIWFLPALWIGVSLVYFFRYKLRWSNGNILMLSLVLYCIGAIGYSYNSLSPIIDAIHDVYTSVFVTWRNGVFNAFVYAFLGYKMAISGGIILKNSILGTIVFGILFLAEAFTMKKIVPSADANFLFMLIPFSYFFFSMVCQIKLPDSRIYVSLRKMSMLIFVSQRLFLTAIPSVVAAGAISGPWDITNNGVLALALVVIEICLFSYIIMIGAKEIKMLNYLM